MAKPARSRGNPALRLAMIRQIHSYLGVFIAPSVLFFAVTGGLQLFRLHEARDAYHPPALIEKLGRVHKDQVFALKPPRPVAAKPAGPKVAPDDHDHQTAGPKVASDDHDHPTAGPKIATVALRWLFLLVAASLAGSTLLGLWMGLRHSRRKSVAWALLIAGAALPVLILAL